ncbi:MAG: hypothetical protein P8Z78_06860 [Gammaproteobacteria bacterium]
MRAFQRFPSLLLFVLTILISGTPSAGTWIKSVESCESCLVERAGEKLLAVPLMQLQKGDRVSVEGESVRLVLVDSADSQVVLEQKQASYSVSEDATEVAFPASVTDALEWFRRAASSLVPGRSMITAGDKNPPQISGMDVDSNKLPEGMEHVVFAWDFGQAPFTAAIVDRHGKPLFEKQTEKQKLPVSLDDWQPGNYRFMLTSNFDGEPVADAYPFSLVDSEELPDELAVIEQAEMPETIRTLYRGIMLAQYPQWRFMALQLAIRARDRPLARVLLEEESH